MKGTGDYGVTIIDKVYNYRAHFIIRTENLITLSFVRAEYLIRYHIHPAHAYYITNGSVVSELRLDVLYFTSLSKETKMNEQCLNFDLVSPTKVMHMNMVFMHNTFIGWLRLVLCQGAPHFRVQAAVT